MRWEDYFIYNPDTGKLYWKYRNDIEASRRNSGMRATLVMKLDILAAAVGILTQRLP